MKPETDKRVTRLADRLGTGSEEIRCDLGQWLTAEQAPTRRLFGGTVPPPVDVETPARVAALAEARERQEQELAESRRKYARAIADLERASAQKCDEMAAEVVDLALLIAGELVARDESGRRQALLTLVKDTVKSVEADGPVVVRVSESDFGSVSSELRDAKPGVVSLVADSAMRSGDCVVETAHTTLDARLASKLLALRAGLTELLAKPDGKSHAE